MTTPHQPAARSRGRALNASLIVIGQSTQSLAFGGIALFLPLIRHDLGLSFGQAGTLAAAGTLTYALMQVPSGYLADRFDPKRLFATGLLGVNLLSLSFVLLHAYGLLLVNQAVSGVFRSMVFAPGLMLISRQFREDRRATAMGLYVAGGFSSNILLNALGPALVGPLGWRVLLALFSASGLIVVSAFFLLGDSAAHAKEAVRPTVRELRGLLAHRVVWLSGYIQFVRLAVVTGLNFWLPSVIVADKGYSLGVAGAVVAIGAAVTAPSNFLGGWVSDRLRRPLLIIGGSLAVLAVTLSTIPLVDALVPLIAVIAVNSIFIQLYFGPLFAVPIARIGPANAGLVSGFGNFCANLGGFAFTYGLGAIKDTVGSFQAGLWTMSGMCVTALAAVYAISRLPAPRNAPAGTPAGSEEEKRP